MRSCEASGAIAATGRVVDGGRQTILSAAQATDAAGRLCATASSTSLLFDLPGPEFLQPVPV